MAGMKAASLLCERGIDVTILESSDRVGGRIKEFQFHGNTFEEGANWIQGLEKE